MSANDVSHWEFVQWLQAARGGTSSSPLRADFLTFWSAVSAHTLAAMLMWAHRGWGQTQQHQQPPVDVTSVSILSLAVLHRIQALLLAGDARFIQEIAIHAHLDATRELLEDFLYYDREISDEKYCDTCLWKYLSDCSLSLPDEEALRWFAAHNPPSSCGKHLAALNEILKRLQDPTPEIGESQWDISSLDVSSKLLSISRLVLPLQVRLLFPVLLIPSFVVAVVSPEPEPGMALTLRPIQQHQDLVPIDILNQSPPPVVEVAPPETEPEKAPPSKAPLPRSPPPEEPPVKPPLGEPPAPQSNGGGGTRTDQPAPPPRGKGEAPSAGDSSNSGSTPNKVDSQPPPPFPTSTVGGQEKRPGGGGEGTDPGAKPGTKSEMRNLAQELSVLVQRRGRPCESRGHVFAVPEGRGLVIDGRAPRIEDIDAMKLALKECKK